jgi:hypothetical protein
MNELHRAVQVLCAVPHGTASRARAIARRLQAIRLMLYLCQLCSHLCQEYGVCAVFHMFKNAWELCIT